MIKVYDPCLNLTPLPMHLSNCLAQFYECGEADEVDGIEDGLEKWLAGLWPALKKAAAPEGSAEAAPAAAAAPAAEGSGGAAPAEGELQGVPPLPRCRVRLAWQGDAGAAAAVRAAEASAPSAADLARRDPAGEYSAEAPFWARVTHARYLTTELSGPDRQVCQPRQGWAVQRWAGCVLGLEPGPA